MNCDFNLSEIEWYPIKQDVVHQDEKQAEESEQTYQFFCWMCLPGNSSGPLRRSCLCIESEMRSLKSHGATAKELYEFGMNSYITLKNEHAELFNMKVQFRLWQNEHQSDCCNLKDKIDFENYHSYSFDYNPNSYGVADNIGKLLASTAEAASQAASSFFQFAEQIDPNYDPFLPIPAMPLVPKKIDLNVVLKPEFGVFEKQASRAQALKNFEALSISDSDDIAGIMAIANASSFVVKKVGEGLNGWFSEIGSNVSNRAEAICNKNPIINNWCQQMKNLPSKAAEGMKNVNEMFGPNYDPYLPIPAMPLSPPPRTYREAMNEVKNLFVKEAKSNWNRELSKLPANDTEYFYKNVNSNIAQLSFTAKEYRCAGLSVEDLRKQNLHHIGIIFKQAAEDLDKRVKDHQMVESEFAHLQDSIKNNEIKAFHLKQTKSKIEESNKDFIEYLNFLTDCN